MLIEPDGRLRITDFGLALALRGDARFGGATSRSGTPQFAAPEQLLGERVDQRADIYSLAATAYFALLGRPPFEGPTPERSEEHTSELQSRLHLVCRLLLEKKKKNTNDHGKLISEELTPRSQRSIDGASRFCDPYGWG